MRTIAQTMHNTHTCFAYVYEMAFTCIHIHKLALLVSTYTHTLTGGLSTPKHHQTHIHILMYIQTHHTYSSICTHVSTHESTCKYI